MTALESASPSDLVGRIKAKAGDLLDVVKEAMRRRIWIDLGYTTWQELCDAEFRDLQVRLPRELRAEHVRDLAAEGMSTRAIAGALGVNRETVARDLSEVAGTQPPEPRPVTGLDGKTYTPSPRPICVAEPAVTAEQFIAQRDTGQVLSPEQWEQNNQPDAPVPDTLAAARAEAARHPSIVTGEAMKHLERARRALLAAGTPTEILADHDTDPIDTTGDWLYEIDASIAVLTPLAAALRRRHIRSVK